MCLILASLGGSTEHSITVHSCTQKQVMHVCEVALNYCVFPQLEVTQITSNSANFEVTQHRCTLKKQRTEKSNYLLQYNYQYNEQT